MQVLNALGAGFVIRDTQADPADAAPEASRLSGAQPPTSLEATRAKVKKGSW
jgi:hypothetical protein